MSTCPVCRGAYSVGVDGNLRLHPRGAVEHCAGSGRPPTAAPPEGAPETPPVPARVRPGVYRSEEPMLADVRTPPPPGYATLLLVAHVPYDGTNGRTPQEEAALLYDDPDHLFRVLADVPNERVAVTLTVPRGGAR
jgi:hypothetical protein